MAQPCDPQVIFCHHYVDSSRIFQSTETVARQSAHYPHLSRFVSVTPPHMVVLTANRQSGLPHPYPRTRNPMPLPLLAVLQPYGCKNMAYTPRTRPAFRTDIHHDIRDDLLDGRLKTLTLWSDAAAGAYLSAAGLLDIRDDPVAICLAADDVYDARTLWLSHDRMAAHWRQAHLPARLAPGPVDLGGESGKLVTDAGIRACFRRWLLGETRAWCMARPRLVRLMCLAMVQDHTRSGQKSEADLYFDLCEFYPVRSDA